jgi:hypothetical protein
LVKASEAAMSAEHAGPLHVRAIVPGWLAAKHRQLAGDVEYERVRDHQRQTAKEQRMNDRPSDAGTGALFRNDRKEKPSHPDYRGDCTIRGKKFWMSAWIKEGAKGKFMSLPFREAEESVDPKSKATTTAKTGSEMPF